MYATDLNSDGVPDIVISSSAGFDLALGAGDGTYSKSRFFAGNPAFPIADLNGDGFPDLVASNEILLSDGKGGIADRFSYLFENAAYAADIDNDGIVDLVSTCGQVLFGAGNGRFLAPAFLGGASSAVAADFDGDGAPDLAIITNNLLSVRHSNSDGTLSETGPYDLETQYALLVSGDWNGDGKADVLVVPSNLAGAQQPQTSHIFEYRGGRVPVSCNIHLRPGRFDGFGRLEPRWKTRYCLCHG